MKRVAPHVHVGDRLLDLRHVASDALVALATCFVMRVLLDCRRVRTIRRIRAVTIEAKNVRRLPQEPIVVRAMHVVATEASDAARVHEAGNEVVALHAVLVGSPIGEMRERCLAEFVLFQFPEILQTLAHMEADGPVISLSGRGSGQGLPLRMALNAGVGCINVIEARQIHDIRLGWLLHVIAARAVTLLAADIPLGHCLSSHIVID